MVRAAFAPPVIDQTWESPDLSHFKSILAIITFSRGPRFVSTLICRLNKGSPDIINLT